MNVELQETVDTLKYFQKGIKTVKAFNDFLTEHKPDDRVNFEVAGMMKGAIFGEYLKLRNEGSILIANHILLEEGLPQRLSPRQEIVLARIDERHNLR